MAYNSTIRVKKKWLSCGHFDYNFSKGRCAQCAKVQDFNKREEKETLKEEDLRGLIEDADALVSRYVRMSAADKDGYCLCFTCGKRVHWKGIQAGHYISRSCMFLRFDYTRQIRCQCVDCNCNKHGNLAIYGQKLEVANPGITEILYEESKMVYHITKEELRGIISELTIKLKAKNA